MKSLCVKVLLVLALLIGFTYTTAYAQVDYSIWDGSLWKVKFTAKGVVFSDPAANEPPDGKARGTEQSWAVMTSDITGTNMSIQIYEKNDAGQCEKGDEIFLTRQYGGPLGFVATIEADFPDPVFSIRGLVYFTGKLKDSALKTAKITTLGGYILEQDWDDPTDRAAFGFTLSGTLLKEPKGCLEDL